MQFTRQTEVAVAILTVCAQESGVSVSTGEMAQRIGTSREAAARAASMLVRNGLLRSERGRNSGLTLAVDPRNVTLGTILRITQPELLSSPEEDAARLPSATAFSFAVDAASAHFVKLAERYTVADLAAA